MAETNKPEKTVEQRIKSETTRLRKIFKDIGKNKLDLLKADIENLAFYTVMCADLKKQILENGVSIKYQNGANQSGEKLSPAAETVDKWSLRVDQITGRLLGSVPEDVQSNKLAEMMARR